MRWVKRQRLNAESPQSDRGLPISACALADSCDRQHDAAQPPTSGRQLPQRGVTLVELLVVITIITILAGLILGVAAVAGETARVAQTKTTVQRLHKLLMEHYDTYKTRRVKVRNRVEQGINDKSSGAVRGRYLAQARLLALRELMLMEIPDRWSDITLSDDPSQIRYPFFLDVSNSASGRTDLSAMYLRRYQQIRPSTDNESAECLYLVITLATGDGEARAQFGESSIGDTDDDGAFEFLDSWGNPIGFLRWAPGFDSLVQIDANTLDNPPTGTPQQAWAAAASSDHDPFDMYRVDDSAIRLIPLVFSAGGDESYGLHMAGNDPPYVGVTQSVLNSNNRPDPRDAGAWPQLTPYQFDIRSNQPYFGTALGDGESTDNIHNHLLGRR